MIQNTFKPYTAVWEITFACNLNCKHCGSSCTTFLPDELTTEEAISLCNDIGQLGLRYLTLSGGEPLMRKDWHLIASALKDNGVLPNIITNGWLLNQETIDLAKVSGICNVAISLDGTKPTHDKIRKEGSFDKISSALDLLKANELPSSIITTINSVNIKELDGIYEFLVEKKVTNWQFQIITPMGNALENQDLYINPSQVSDIVDFAHKKMQENKVRFDLADCVGYYSLKDTEIRNYNKKGSDSYWSGCPAGRYSFGIKCNGDIIGCTSIRDDSYIEGNVRDRSLVEIWNDPNSFSWNRYLTKKDLSGTCNICQYGNYCLAGCSVQKIMNQKTIFENHFCLYKQELDAQTSRIDGIEDLTELQNEALQCIENQDYQLANVCYSKLLSLDKKNTEFLRALGFVNYQLENFEVAKEYNIKILDIDEGNSYAYKGLGLCLAALGETEKGIDMLKKAVGLDPKFYDARFDLALVLFTKELFEDAKLVLEEARLKFPDKQEHSEDLYQSIINCINR